MRQYIIFIILALVSVELNSQTLTVIDIESGETLPMVTIQNQTGSSILYSDVNGQSEISVIKDHEWIKISYVGYKSIETSWANIVQNKFVIKMTPSLIELDQIIVSASKWSQSGRNIPMKVSILSAKDIAFQNPQTAADLLGFSGKVFIQKSQQGGGSPMIRGFATNRLLYAIDGVRMNTAIFRSGNIQNVISLDAFATENAEILFGPGSVIYGSDAIGGVMSFQTLSPKFSASDKTLFTGSATTRYSTANQEKTAHFHLKIGSQKWASVSSVSYNDFGDLRMGRKGPDEYLKKLDVVRIGDKDVIVHTKDSLVQVPSGYSQLNLMQKISYKYAENLEFQYAFHHSATSEYSRYDRHIRYRNGLPRYGEWKYGPQKWTMHQFNILHQGNGNFYDQMAFRLASQTFAESRIDRDINQPTRHIRSENVSAYSANLDMTKSIKEKGKLTYGIEAVINDVKSEGIDQDIIQNTSITGPSRYPQALWTSYAAYASYDHRFSDKWSLLAGTRYNYFALNAQYDTTFYPFPFVRSSYNNGALTGSMGAVYRPYQSTALMVNISTGFRAPNVDDSGKVFDAIDGFVTVPNPDLKAEYAYNAEIGWVQVISDKIRLDMSIYYTKLNDALVRRPFQLNGMDSILYNGVVSKIEAIQNAAIASVNGMQLGIEIKPGLGLTFTSSYNIQRGEEELDNGTLSPSRHAAPNFGSSTLSWTKRRFTIAVGSMYSDGKTYGELPIEEQNKPEIYAKDTDGKPYSPSWIIFNAKGQYKISKYLNINASIENMTDIRYRPYSSGIVAPGRNFVISGQLIF